MGESGTGREEKKARSPAEIGDLGWLWEDTEVSAEFSVFLGVESLFNESAPGLMILSSRVPDKRRNTGVSGLLIVFRFFSLSVSVY